MNLLRGRLERRDDVVEVAIGSQRLSVPQAVLDRRPALAHALGGEVVIGIRPETLENALNGSGAGRVLDLPVVITEAMGSDKLVHLEPDAAGVMVKDVLDSDQATFTARLPPHTAALPGERLRLLVDMERAHFFDPLTGVALWGSWVRGSWARIKVSPARRVAKQLAFGDVRSEKRSALPTRFQLGAG